jgi:hypothetical protein
MYLGAAAGALVLFNIVIVVLLARANHSERDPDEDLIPPVANLRSRAAPLYGSRCARLAVISAKCCSLGDPH